MFAQWLHAPTGAPTMLLYAHADVQPATPGLPWRRHPFEPWVEDGAIFGRGAQASTAHMIIVVLLLLPCCCSSHRHEKLKSAGSYHDYKLCFEQALWCQVQSCMGANAHSANIYRMIRAA